MGVIVKPKTWADEENVTYTDINSNFDTVYNEFNGSIEDANIDASAAIGVAKISGTAVNLSSAQTISGAKTFSTAPLFTFGTEAAGDIFYGAANGTMTRLAVGSTDDQLSIASGVPAWKTMHSAHVYNDANQSLTDATEVALTFNTEGWDTSSIHDTASNTSRLTLPSAGKYLIIGQVQFTASSGGLRYILIKKSGTTEMARTTQMPETVHAHTMQVQVLVNASANDYFELLAYHNAGAGINALTGSANTFFQVQRLV